MSDENYTEILQHRIRFSLFDDGPQELDEASVEHIEKTIKEGCNQGELCFMSDNQETERRGWWSIEKAEYKSEGKCQEVNMRNQLITSAFFMEGLHDARSIHKVKSGYDAIIETWGKGCIELVDALVSYVPITNQLCEVAALACDGNYPGVFDYEVSSCFGAWFGQYILEHGDEPPKIEAYAWLVKEVGIFFTQGMTDEQAEDVKKAINKTSIKHCQ